MQDRAGFHFACFDAAGGLPGAQIRPLHGSPDGTFRVGTHAGPAGPAGQGVRLVPGRRTGAVLGHAALAPDAHERLYADTANSLAIGNVREGAVRTRIPGPASREPVHSFHTAPAGAAWFGCGTSLCQVGAPGRAAKIGGGCGAPPGPRDTPVKPPGETPGSAAGRG